MTVFQIMLLIVVTALFIVSVLSIVRGWTTRRYSFFWTGVWLLAVLATLWPDLTTRIANTLGINRGKDLLLYCAVLMMLIGFFMVYVRLRQMRRQLTLLIRKLAIMEAHENAPGDPAEADFSSPRDEGTKRQ